MIIDINKLTAHKILRLTFSSKTKAKKFIRTLLIQHNYVVSETCKATMGRIGGSNCALLIYKNSLMSTTLSGVEECTYSHSEFIVKDYKISRRSNKTPYTNNNTHYLTKDIENSDLALRYYTEFANRLDYVGKWFVKCKRTKEYLEITEAQAKKISETMCSGTFSRVIGFREANGFKRIIVDSKGIVTVTLNGKLCIAETVKDIDEQEWY